MATTSISFEERRSRPPSHPGELLKHDVLPALGITQQQFAEHLKLSRKTINEILGGTAPVTAETALKLGTLLGNSPLFWLNLQAAYDLWHAQQLVSKRQVQDLLALHSQYAAEGKL